MDKIWTLSPNARRRSPADCIAVILHCEGIGSRTAAGTLIRTACSVGEVPLKIVGEIAGRITSGLLHSGAAIGRYGLRW